MSEPTAPVSLPDQTLVGRAQEGDTGSFEVLVRRYQAPLFRLAYRMLADRGEAEDVVQDTLVLVWRQLPALQDASLFRSWAYSIATRRCLSLLRTRGRRQTSPVEADDLQTAHDRGAGPGTGLAAATAPDPAAAAEQAASVESLQRLLQTLPDEQRACWVLREMHGLTYDEISTATRLPVSTVRGRLARARQNLAKGMASWR